MLRSNQCIGITQLRNVTATRLREQQGPLVVFTHSDPVAVLVPYALYLSWQKTLASKELQGR